MKTKIMLLSSIMVILGFLCAVNALASYIGSTSGNDETNDPTNVLGVITTDPGYTPDDYDFDSYPLTFYGKFEDIFEDVAEGTFFQSDDGSFKVTVTAIKKDDPSDTTGEAVAGTWLSTSPVDFIVIKASDGFSVYSPDQTVNGVWSGSWSTSEGDLFAINEGQKGLSHLSVYTGGTPGGGAQVPEPVTVLLLGSGLLGFFGYRKKFWKSRK